MLSIFSNFCDGGGFRNYDDWKQIKAIIQKYIHFYPSYNDLQKLENKDSVKIYFEVGFNDYDYNINNFGTVIGALPQLLKKIKFNICGPNNLLVKLLVELGKNGIEKTGELEVFVESKDVVETNDKFLSLLSDLYPEVKSEDLIKNSNFKYNGRLIFGTGEQKSYDTSRSKFKFEIIYPDFVKFLPKLESLLDLICEKSDKQMTT
jgi:hypothetical protein